MVCFPQISNFVLEMWQFDSSRFYDALRFCTDIGITTTTYNSELTGNLFEYEGDHNTIFNFKKIEDLIEAAKVIKIEDIIHSMNFGNSEKYDSVIINHNLSPKTRIELTKEIWKPFLHYEKGYCYTFDPKQYNFSQNSVVYKGENLLRIKMNLDVSFQIHIHILKK